MVLGFRVDCFPTRTPHVLPTTCRETSLRSLLCLLVHGFGVESFWPDGQ